MEALTEASIMTLLRLLVSASPLVMGVTFAIRPNERLALMRPLSLAGIFAGVCSLLVGIANGLRALATLQTFDPQTRGFRRLCRSRHPDVSCVRVPDHRLAVCGDGMRKLS